MFLPWKNIINWHLKKLLYRPVLTLGNKHSLIYGLWKIYFQNWGEFYGGSFSWLLSFLFSKLSRTVVMSSETWLVPQSPWETDQSPGEHPTMSGRRAQRMCRRRWCRRPYSQEGTRGSLIEFPLTWEARGLDINGKNYWNVKYFVLWLRFPTVSFWESNSGLQVTI